MTLLHRTVTHQHTHPTPDHPHTERLIAITKAWITWQARTLTTEARERCGAHALFSVNALADFPTTPKAPSPPKATTSSYGPKPPPK